MVPCGLAPTPRMAEPRAEAYTSLVNTSVLARLARHGKAAISSVHSIRTLLVEGQGSDIYRRGIRRKD